jgi:hypothetical protein
VRAVTALRLAGPAPDVDRTVRGALQQAAVQFRQVGMRHPRADPRNLARRRQARCVAVLRSVLVRSGAEDEAEELAEEWGTATDVVGPLDVTPPDLAGPGWTGLAAEYAVAADEGWGLR